MEEHAWSYLHGYEYKVSENFFVNKNQEGEQKDNELHITDDLTESGFVISPFDDRDDTVLMPLSKSDQIVCSVMSSTSTSLGINSVETSHK